MPSNRITAALAALTVSLLFLTGCVASDSKPDATASATATAVSIPESPLGEATSWALDVLGSDSELTEADVTERFAPEMIAQIGSPADLVTSLTSLQTLAPFTVLAYEETGDVAGTRVEAKGEGSERAFYLLTVSLDDAGLLTGLSLQPAPEIPETAADWEELTDRVEEIGAPVAVTVFDVSSGDVGTPTFSAGDLEGAQPSGSMFKLFVLLAVVDAVDKGTLGWNDTLTLTDATRSLPSGVLQAEPDGATVSVEEAALGMMSISDNTATDLLIEAVGTDAVDAQIAEHGPDGAEKTTPMAPTRAFFQLGWGDQALRAEWAASDDTARMALLDRVASMPLTTTGADVNVPVWQDGVDWFFSAADLARAFVALQDASDTEAGAPLAAILSANPGLDSTEGWDFAAFKGGSSIGVMGGTWLLDAGDTTSVVVVQSATENPEEYLAQRSAMYLGTNAAALLAEE